MKKILKTLVSIFKIRLFENQDSELRQWYELEYRKELAGRIGEQYNPFCMR